MARATATNRISYRRIILLTLLALSLGWYFAYLQLPEPPPSHPAAESSNPVLAGAMATAAFGSEIIFNAAAGNSIQVTLEGDVETSSIANPRRGQVLTLLLCQDAVGGRQMSWPGNVRLAGGGFALSQEPGLCDSLTLVYDEVYWYETARSQQLAGPDAVTSESNSPLLDEPPPDSSIE